MWWIGDGDADLELTLTKTDADEGATEQFYDNMESGTKVPLSFLLKIILIIDNVSI